MMATATHTTGETMTRKPAHSVPGQVSSPAPRVRKQKSKPARTLVRLDSQVEKRLHAAVCHYGNHFELAKQAGIGADVLSRFARRERNLRLDTAGRVAAVLGLVLADEA